MHDLTLILGCALQKGDFHNFTGRSLKNLTKNTSGFSDADVSELGAATGLLLATCVHVVLSVNYFVKRRSVPDVASELSKIFSGKTFSRTLALTILVLVFPLVAAIFLLALIYKAACSVIIKRIDNNFSGFLDSFDVFWSLENDATKSIINVLGVIESDSPFTLANSIKQSLRNIVPNKNTQKIFYRRHEKYGFYYWRTVSSIDIDEYVEVVESPTDRLDVTGLENCMADVQTKPMPCRGAGLFQILITKERVGKYNEDRGEYGIIFRIHHSVGDGVALIEFLCQTLADSAEEPFNNTRKYSVPNCTYGSPVTFSDKMRKVIQIPICLVDAILRKSDKNSLHGQPLKGRKVFKWTNDDNLLAKIKEIRGNCDLHFTDILLKAVSSGLQNYFEETKAPIPDDIAMILPVRFPKKLEEGSTVNFKNDFTVTTLQVPVQRSGIDEIKVRCEELRKSPDALVNYYFLKVVTSILPRSILYPLLQSVQATLVFSNMPGPDQKSICGGNQLRSLVFFVPNKGTTGLGITALCYGGVLRFAAMADAALVSNPEDLSIILDGMVEELGRLHRQYAK